MPDAQVLVAVERLEGKLDTLNAKLDGRLNLVEDRVGRIESVNRWVFRTCGTTIITLLGAGVWRLARV